MSSNRKSKKQKSGKKNTSQRAPVATSSLKQRRRDKAFKLQHDISTAQQMILEQAKKIAKNHGRSLPWVTSRLLLGGKLLRSRRSVNAWTVHLTKSLASINSKRKAGDRIKMSSIPADTMEEIKETYHDLDEKELEALREEGAAARKEKATAGRTSEIGRQKDFDATFNNLIQEAVAVQERTRCEILILAVRGDTMHTAEPMLYASPKAKSWISWKFKLSLSDMGLHLEAFVVGNLAEGEFTIVGKKINDHVAWVRERLGSSLLSFLQEARLIKPGEKLKMAYKNYNDAIVKRFGVVLHGWPLEGELQDAAKLARPNLNKVIEALKDGSCHWKRLTAEELRVRRAALVVPAAVAASDFTGSRSDANLTPAASGSASPAALFTDYLPPPTPAEAAAMEALANMGFNINGPTSLSLDGTFAANDAPFTSGTSHGPSATVAPYGATPSLLDDDATTTNAGGIAWAPAASFTPPPSDPSLYIPPLTWTNSA
ncbi:hypothetical protein FA95DRAFT_1613053 [Auriscalpium vulgare]|uniref:Uncharacterized protein n=1 Tax=Auriscalpium vulgare TaxID=40419 RepID=A0ACB8R3Z7_9AGAM|nr:hypothetical protein FA95DRAFT_1613053 [Auriscalpium vulgare]